MNENKEKNSIPKKIIYTNEFKSNNILYLLKFRIMKCIVNSF